MGLDMYLLKSIYIGGKHLKGKTAEKKFTFTGPFGDRKITIAQKDICTIKSEVGYWRKANHIHKWFVDNVQDGEDNCQTYRVTFGELANLKALCEKILAGKDKAEQRKLANELLPCQSGFFFGTTNIQGDDELHYYLEDCKDTVNIINKLSDDDDYEYSSSW